MSQTSAAIRHAASLIASRRGVIEGTSPSGRSGRFHSEEEGGCGVTGFACSIPVPGRHIYEPSRQMHNRGNGLGGGVAAMGFVPDTLGIDDECLREDYILQIALLDPEVIRDLEARFVSPYFDVHHSGRVPTVEDYRDIDGLLVRPPDVWRFIVRVKPDVLRSFAEAHDLAGLPLRDVEDEFVYQNSFKINKTYYEAVGEKKAFVLSHGRNLFIFKIVGYAEQVVRYYRLEDFPAHVWIAHQRYPTRGRVWHPAGAHPFIGLNEALVHNGDFANYHSVAEYLRQRNIVPLFLTDTEVAALLFDLYSRVYKYPLEYIIEALAPTTERDFDRLPRAKQEVYRRILATHIHGSPDGPWFFIVARNDTARERLELIGITDTSMLRPQVFALQEGEVQVGLVCSEKQAIDATLRSLAQEDPRIGTVADRYWNARGGSHTDGGAFVFSLSANGHGHGPGRGPMALCVTDKFGRPLQIAQGQAPLVLERPYELWDRVGAVGLGGAEGDRGGHQGLLSSLRDAGPQEIVREARARLEAKGYEAFLDFVKALRDSARAGGDSEFETALRVLTVLADFRYPTFDKRRRSVLQILFQAIEDICDSVELIGGTARARGRYCRIDWESRKRLQPPATAESCLVIDGSDFPAEGRDSDSRLMRDAYLLGWRRFIVYGLRGQRFHGCGLGPSTGGTRIDIYGSSGDYLGSGIDGLEMYVHGNGQDQLGQIMKSGKLVVFGDVGQTFLYGAKGGEVYVLGNAAGRPLINAVGRPRVVINGTCLDFLAESFMAGDPLDGGGFVVVNGLGFDDQGMLIELDTPYPGSNLFSLASGGAVYIRDPHRTIDSDQLNGGEIVELTAKDWSVILPYLLENERLFGIRVEEDLLVVGSERRPPEGVYRKVQPICVEMKDGLDE
jgi:glutamate synthase domain-containing protein 1/glutamate synthase domain-containing protein 3